MDGGQAGIRIRITAVLAAALATAGCSHSPRAFKKLIVLGIDGMDPGFLERHWAELPNLDRLRREGDFKRLGTTIPPQSPVAWSTVITGLDPGGHGIFDFVHRDPATLSPISSLGETIESKHTLSLGPYRLPLSRGEVRSFRKGRAFWQILSEHGIPSTILRMPVNFPPVRCHCQELAGMGTPDLDGTFGTFTFFTDDPSAESKEVAGGRIVRVGAAGNDVTLTLEGPVNSLRKDRRRTSAPIEVHLDREAGAARFDVDGTPIILRQGEWSDWVRIRFPLISGIQSVRGMIRIYAQELSPRLRIYVSPLNIDPAAPELPLSVPPDFSRALAEAIGPFYTQGIAEDTAALRRGVFQLPEYLAQSRAVTEEQLALLRHAIKQLNGGVFFQHLLGIDQNSHMLWGRHESELLETYRTIDAAVGWVRNNAGDATLIVMSDHGFTTFDHAVHLNTWLYREGFLSLNDAGGIDWAKTQAYALGLNGLYLNLRGRERNGIVEPGAQAELILRVISRRLTDLREVIAGVYAPRALFHGDALAAAPDLIIGYRPGYRGSWESALGEVPAETIVENRDAWIGDHAIAPQYVPGVLLANRAVRLADPQLADLTVTILREFGITPPAEMRGRFIF